MMYIKSPELTRNWMLTFDQHLPTSSTAPPTPRYWKLPSYSVTEFNVSIFHM